MFNSEILASFIVYPLALCFVIVLVSLYFRFMLKVIFRNKLESIDYLIEYGKLGPNYLWPLTQESESGQKIPFLKSIVVFWQKIISKQRIGALIRFVENSQFMTEEDIETYTSELKDVRREWSNHP